MNILAIDTATEACSVALLANDQQFDVFEVCPQGHSQRLLPMVKAILEQANVSLSDLDGLAYGRGPGSFTGVRIATGMIQGLALGTDLPVVQISTLQALAQQCLMDNNAETIASAIDARMGEVYFAQFQAQQGLAVPVSSEAVLAPEDAASAVVIGSQAVGTGWAAYPQLSQGTEVKVHEDILYPHAKYMLPLAAHAFENKEAVTVEQIKPVYLRDKVTWKKLPGKE